MPLIHIRVIELKCNESRNRVNYFFVNFHTDSKPIVDQKLSIDICQKNSKVLSSCSKSVTLNVDNYSQNQLYVNLKRHRMIISDDDVGKVVIPLKWFPRRKVVREWFPLTSAGRLKKTLMDNINDLQNSNTNKTVNKDIEYDDGSENLMLLLDIHLAKKNDKPFVAPFSSMKVLPSWKKPLLLQGSEFPPVPPITYILGRKPDALTDPDIPPHQSFVIVLPPNASIPNEDNSNNSNNTNNNNNNSLVSNNTININNTIYNSSNNDNISNAQQSQGPSYHQVSTNQTPESNNVSELQPYFPAPQPNTYTPAENLILPPFMQGNSEATHVPLITEYMSPYSNPNNVNEIFATDDIPNVYYPQVNIITEEDEDDDDDDDDDDNENDEDDNENDDIIEEEEISENLKDDNNN